MAKRTEYTFTVSEVSLSTGRQKSIRVTIDDADVRIPVDEAVYAYWQEQFVRKNPTPQQRKRFATFMNVVRAAYKKGVADGAKGTG